MGQPLGPPLIANLVNVPPREVFKLIDLTMDDDEEPIDKKVVSM
jgi:hypothetical protein